MVPTPVLLPGKFHGQRSLVSSSPWSCKESDTTERLHFCFHTVKGFSVVNETDFLFVCVFFFFFLNSLPSFSYDPANVDNLISGSSFFCKSSLDIWKLLVGIMLKPSMQDFKHDLTMVGDECNRPMVSTFFSTTLLGNWNED